MNKTKKVGSHCLNKRFQRGRQANKDQASIPKTPEWRQAGPAGAQAEI